MNTEQQATEQTADDDQADTAPLPIVDRLDAAIARNPGTPALHLTAAEYDELRADPRTLSRIEITSDGVDYRGFRLAVEGGVELPAPIPAVAVYDPSQDGQA